MQDLITVSVFAQNHSKGRNVVLCGMGRAGLWSLLAAPAVDAVVADCDSLETASDNAWLEQDLFVPGIRKIGGFEGVAALATPHPVLLHNTGEKFSTVWLNEVYGNLKTAKALRRESARLDDETIVNWIAQLKLE